ncbi:hypothetical protein ABFS83_07G001700 [Erythranthe nasuta]
MASSSSYNNIYLLFLAVFTFVSLSALPSSAVIIEIPPSASPPTPTSLLDVTNHTIQSTKMFLITTKDRIHERKIEAIVSGNPVLEQQFQKCEVQYRIAIKALVQSLNYLQIGNYKILPSLASTALLQVKTIDRNFLPIGSEPADIKARNQLSIDRCTNLLALVNRLVASHKNLFF